MSVSAVHEDYGRSPPFGLPLEPWLQEARKVQESIRIELGWRVAHGQVRDTLGDAALLWRAECARDGLARWART